MFATEQRVDLIEEQVDGLEAVFERFMARTDMLLRSMEWQMREYREEQALRMAQFIAQAEKDRQEQDRRMERRMEQNRQEQDRRMERRMEQNRQEQDRRMEQNRRESKQDHRKLARQLGEITNRQGTLVEDIITPSIRRLAQHELGCGELQFFAGRIDKPHAITGKFREFDALYVDTKAVLLNESKTTARPEYAKKFVEFLQKGGFSHYFPEYAGKPIVPVFSSLYIPDNVLVYLTRHKIYAVGMGDDTMVVLNREQLASG
ncbi:MAG: hypothetical protein ACE5GO_10410 [Anaerolineales bacterium]